MRERATDLTILERLAPPAGREVVDIGCGGGDLVRALSGLGARVTGIEVSERQLATARARDDGLGARYLIGGGQALPLPDASVDLAVFMRTLHHVPLGQMAAALAEARRVLRPGGAVYFAEPLAEGDWFELTSLVEDEREVRRAAQAAVAEASAAGLRGERRVEYDVAIEVADVNACRARTVSVDPARASVFDARRDEIEAAFQRLGEPGSRAGARAFLAPMRAELLRAA
ncbi:MAG: class I SAM-dependent methyltransferase [Solirubrobacteraceae bacterium]